MGIFDLEKQFAFYGAYHSNPVNIYIHMLFVWPILFTALILFNFTPSIFNLPPIQFCEHSSLVLNYGFLFALVYAIFYVCLDKKAGSLAALLCLICWVYSGVVARQLGFSLAWKVKGFFYFLSSLSLFVVFPLRLGVLFLSYCRSLYCKLCWISVDLETGENY